MIFALAATVVVVWELASRRLERREKQTPRVGSAIRSEGAAANAPVDMADDDLPEALAVAVDAISLRDDALHGAHRVANGGSSGDFHVERDDDPDESYATGHASSGSSSHEASSHDADHHDHSAADDHDSGGHDHDDSGDSHDWDDD